MTYWGLAGRFFPPFVPRFVGKICEFVVFVLSGIWYLVARFVDCLQLWIG